MSVVLVILVIAAIYAFRDYFRTRDDFPLLHLDDDGILGSRAGAGIHQRIREQMKMAPGGPLDYTPFPRIPYGDGDYYAFGARLFHNERQRIVSGDWRMVPQSVLAVKSRKIKDWRMLEANLKEVDRLEHRKEVMAAIEPGAVTPKVAALFREVAVKSDNYNAVAWGIALGCLSARQSDIEELLPLGRHSELTADVVVAVMEQSKRFPQLRHQLAGLLPHLYDWGLLHVVLTAINHPDQLPADDFRREIIVQGMRNGGVLKGDIARILVLAEWLGYSTSALFVDEELRAAIAQLIEALTSTPEPPGQITLDDSGRETVDDLYDMVRPWPDDFWKLMALRGLGLVYGLAYDTWPEAADRLEEIHDMVTPLCSVPRIEAAMNDPHTRTTALIVAAEVEMRAVAARVLELVRETRDPLAAEVLTIVGDREHLVELKRMLPDIVGPLPRSSSQAIGQNEGESQIYAGIVAALGNLGTKSARSIIRAAARDNHPMVRGAAMVAMGRLQRWTLDPESKNLVRALLDDPFEGVRDRARETAAFHTMNASLEGTPHKGTLTFDLPNN